MKKMKNNNELPDLIVVDLTLPGDKDGKDLILEIKEIAPDTYVIASSGYSNDFVMQNFDDFGFDNVLRKPFSKQELEQVLKEWYKKKKEKK
ncbi:response regulator [Candidatus Harpocratesius sp.]